MKNKNILITGANGNLGSAVSQFFLNAGWNVAGCVHLSDENHTETPAYKEFEANLFDAGSAKETVEKASDQYGVISAAVLTAGGYTQGNLKKTEFTDIQKYIRLNFETAYNIVQPLVQKMKAQREGKIFFIGSKTGRDTRKARNSIAYSLSKSLLFQLVNIINADTKKTGVRAYIVVPDTIDTPQNRKAMPDEDFSKWQSPARIAEIIGRYMTDEDSDKTEIIIEEEI